MIWIFSLILLFLFYKIATQGDCNHNMELICEIKKMEGRIMSVISVFTEKQIAFNARIATAIDGVKADVIELKRIISEHVEDLEDQAKLDALVAAGEALANKAEELDSMTPPVIPTV